MPSSPSKRRAGPRSDIDAKGRILDEARRAFSENGYAATTLRGVATAAGVDVALVPYYFGNKQNLFTASMKVPLQPGELIERAFAKGADVAGAGLVEMFLSVWDDPETGPAFLAMFRAAMTQEDARRALAEFASTEILTSYANHLDAEDARLRASLAASQLIGMVMLRYVIRLDPWASMPRERVVALVGPNVQRYLTGDLDSA